MSGSRPRRFLATIVALLLAVPVALAGSESSWAVTEDVEAAITEAQRQIEESAAAYEDAVARIDELEAEIKANEERIGELEAQLPQQRERSDEALAAIYKMNREGYSLINMVLSSESIVDFLSRVDYLTRLQDRNMETIRLLSSMEEELTRAQDSLDEALSEAKRQEQEAQDSLAVAKAAREMAQREAQEQARREREAQEAARKAAEEAAAKKAAEEAAAQEAAEESERGQAVAEEAPNADEAAAEAEEVAEETPTVSPSDDGADWDEDKQAFVDSWAGRIDNYLSGSPLAGQGATFASAAWDYGVDPRWSPAISAVESSKGAACFRSHNAWGWGSASWGSWEEAIDAHVAGLARGYGYTLSESAAKKYCPPNWRHWYDRCAAEMNSI